MLLKKPVVLVAFNRPELTARVFAAIRAAEPAEMFLIVDGPRSDVSGDGEKCAATRRILEAVDWPCMVRRRYAEHNLGLEANVELGLDWVFSQVSEAIIFEDDCVPVSSFFRYAADLLDRYRDDDRVWQISGSGLGVPRGLFGESSYAFTSWASVWGWATWADRWQRHREVFPRTHARDAEGRGDAPVRSKQAHPRAGSLVTRSGRRHFAEAAKSVDTVTHGWDKHWWLTMMTEGGLAISPAVNLVENVGWGEDATHGGAPGRKDHSLGEAPLPLVHPSEVSMNVGVERELELVLARVGGRVAMLARRMVRTPRMRRAARSFADSRALAVTVRFYSRVTDRSSRV